MVNGVKADTGQHSYAHDQNKWSFSFITKTLKYRNEIIYKHRLIGIDEDWIASPYEERIVSYKSLIMMVMNQPVRASSILSHL